MTDDQIKQQTYRMIRGTPAKVAALIHERGYHPRIALVPPGEQAAIAGADETQQWPTVQPGTVWLALEEGA